MDSLEFIDNKKIYINKLIDINEYICDEKNRSMIISIVASGDPTFYGITNYIKSKATLEFQVIPGISSFQYLTCKLNMSWNNAYLGSLHGRKEDFLTVVNNHDLSIWLTDKENNPAILCEILHKEKVRCKVVIGENLSYEDEIITNGTPEEFMNKKYDSLSVFIVDRTSR